MIGYVQLRIKGSNISTPDKAMMIIYGIIKVEIIQIFRSTSIVFNADNYFIFCKYGECVKLCDKGILDLMHVLADWCFDVA